MRYAVGIDLGGTNIAAGLVNESFDIIDKISYTIIAFGWMPMR